jgi:hypothetical protein
MHNYWALEMDIYLSECDHNSWFLQETSENAQTSSEVELIN